MKNSCKFQLVFLSGQIGFVSIATVTKYVLIVCYDHRIGNLLIEINITIAFKFRSIITKFANPFRSRSPLFYPPSHWSTRVMALGLCKKISISPLEISTCTSDFDTKQFFRMLYKVGF